MTWPNRSLVEAIIATLIMVFYAQFILGHYSTCFSIHGATNSLGLYFGYSPEEVLTFFETRSKEQLICYAHFLKVWDAVFPIIYTTMYVFWIIYLLKKWLLFSTIPIMHMIADWIENYFEITMVNYYLRIGEIPGQLVATSSILTIIKWILSVLTYAIIVYGIIHKLKLFATRPKPDSFLSKDSKR